MTLLWIAILILFFTKQNKTSSPAVWDGKFSKDTIKQAAKVGVTLENN